MGSTAGFLIWAQAGTGGDGAGSLAVLGLRRWCGGLTLCSPQIAPSFHGLFALLLGLSILLLVVLVVQGPARAARQLFQLGEHLRLAREAARCVWRSPRAVVATIGFTVAAWTAIETLAFLSPQDQSGVQLLRRSRWLGELAVEQGALAALSPLRDVAGLGSNWLLVNVGLFFLLQAANGPRSNRSASGDAPAGRGRPRSGWVVAAATALAAWSLYRMVAFAARSPDLPLGGCLMVDAVLLPALMLLADGLLLAWLLVDIRNAGIDPADEPPLDPLQAAALLPGVLLACLAALPARYAATFTVLAANHLPTRANTTVIGDFVRWLLGWGLVDLQAAGLVFIGLVGAVAWTRGRPGAVLTGYRRMLAAEGGRLVAVLAIAACGAALVSTAAYALVLLLPARYWVLWTADAYAHFATLPIGLWTLSAMVELARRALPSARAAARFSRSVPRGPDAREEDAEIPMITPAN